ncbi:MAG: PDZ domain-containing protein [Bacteroidota bacterium]
MHLSFRPLVFLCFIFSLFIGFESRAQSHQEEIIFSQRMSIHQSQTDGAINRIRLIDREIETFDVAAYLAKHYGQSNIQIRGISRSNQSQTKYRFDSQASQTTEDDCRQFCQQISKMKKRPFLGVSTHPEETFEGVVINDIFEQTPAEIAGLQIGDVITHLDEEEIRSGCDLRSLVSIYEIGRLITIRFIRNGKNRSTTTNVGFRVHKEMTWMPCCDTLLSDLDGQEKDQLQMSQMLVFPNPNNGLAQMQYRSEQYGGLLISITDLSGKLIYQNEVDDFSGFYQEYLDISREAAGIYFLHLVQGDQIQTRKIVVQKE